MTSQIIYSFSALAAADLSANQFHFVKIDANGNIALCVAGDPSVGVTQNNPLAGQAVSVGNVGIAKVKAGAAFTAGALAASDVNACAVPATTGKVALGTFMQNGNVGDLAPVLLDVGSGRVV